MAQPHLGFRALMASAPFGLRRGAGANTVGFVVVVALKGARWPKHVDSSIPAQQRWCAFSCVANGCRRARE